MRYTKGINTYLLMLALLVCNAAYTQKQTTHHEQVWLGYFNQTRLSEKWGVWAEGQLRTKENLFTNFSQSIARIGLTYYVNNDTKLTGGYAYVNHFPADSHSEISMPEHRIWQQLQWHTRYKTIRLMQWFRLEERYRRKVKDSDELADGYNFNWRARYNFFLSKALSRNAFAPKTFSFIVNDELHVNFGKEIVNNYFDQNRFFLGFAYHLNAHDNFQFGYMNVFQQLSAGNRYREIHTVRLFYFQNLDLRKKQKN